MFLCYPGNDYGEKKLKGKTSSKNGTVTSPTKSNNTSSLKENVTSSKKQQREKGTANETNLIDSVDEQNGKNTTSRDETGKDAIQQIRMMKDESKML